MSQQVNLLAPIFRKQQTLLSGRLALLVCALVVAVLGVLHAVTVWQVAGLAREQQRLEARRDQATGQLNQLAEQMKGGGKSQPLVEERDRLKAELLKKREALAALSRSELGNTTGFSPQLIGFARQRLNGLWLTGIKLSGGGRSIELRGMALAEGLLPRYLTLLGSEPIFRGTRFGHAALNRDADGAGGRLRFELRSHDPGIAPPSPEETPVTATAPEAPS